MFKVVEVDYCDGLEYRKTVFRSYLFGDCIAFIVKGIQNISTAVREKYKKFFIFDKTDRMIPYVMV